MGYNVGSVKMVTGDLIEENIRIGRIVKIYPRSHYGLETDSPSTLAAYPNGLTDRKHLEWADGKEDSPAAALETSPLSYSRRHIFVR